jgi:peroxiredoxin Q/BCP
MRPLRAAVMLSRRQLDLEREEASMAKTPRVGEEAPDFELPGTDGPFKLSDHRGERVVLLFYPGDNTMVCTKQFCSYRDRAEDFAALDATVVGISGQNLASHEGFVAKNSLNVPLLADVDGEVSRAYSAHGHLGTKRAVIAIDEQGIVRHRHDHLLGLDYQSVDDLRSALSAIPAAAPQ